MKFAHALDDRLAGLFVGRNAEGRIFCGKTLQREAHFFLVGFGLRLDSELDNRLRELHALEHDRLHRIAQRVARRRVFQTDDGDNVACIGFFDFFTAV